MSDRPGYVDCSDPTLSRMQCRLAPNCEWEDRECILGSWPVSPSQGIVSPSPTDEIFPTEVPTEMPTTLSPTEEPTVIPVSLFNIQCAVWDVLLIFFPCQLHK